MPKPNPVNLIIQNCDAVPRARDDSERIVIFDATNGRILDRRPLIHFGRDIRTFLIRVAREHLESDWAEIKVKIPQAPDVPGSFISIRYAAYCLPGAEASLVIAMGSDAYFAAGSSLSERIEACLLEAFAEFFGARPFADESCPVPTAENLDEQLEIALKARLKTTFPRLTCGTQVLWSVFRPKSSKTIQIKVRPSDSSEIVALNLTIQAVPDPSAASSALSGFTSEKLFENEVCRALERVVAAKVTAADLRFDLQEGVRAVFHQTLNDLLRVSGYQVAQLWLEPEKPNSLTNQIDVDLDIEKPIVTEVRLDGRPDPLRLETTLRLVLEDRILYLQKGAPALQAWASTNVKSCVKDAANACEYVEFLTDFDTIRANIIRNITEKAKDLGYRAQAIITKPDSEDYSLLSKFDLPVTSTTFATQEAGVEANISVTVFGRLENLRAEAVKRLLRQNKPVLREVEHELTSELRKCLLGRTPAEVFTHFDLATGDAQSVRAELETAISKVLDSYGVAEGSERRISVKRERTRLDVCLQELRKEPVEIPVTIMPHNGAEELSFSITVDVNGVAETMHDGDKSNRGESGYRQFAQRQPTVEVLRKNLTDYVSKELAVLPPRDLRFTSPEQLLELQTRLESLVRVSARQYFGLDVSTAAVGRAQSFTEALRRKAAREAYERDFKRDTTSENHVDEQDRIIRETELKVLEARGTEAELNAQSDNIAGAEAALEEMKKQRDANRKALPQRLTIHSPYESGPGEHT
jgi:hypothetical protein